MALKNYFMEVVGFDEIIRAMRDQWPKCWKWIKAWVIFFHPLLQIRNLQESKSQIEVKEKYAEVCEVARFMVDLVIEIKSLEWLHFGVKSHESQRISWIFQLWFPLLPYWFDFMCHKLHVFFCIWSSINIFVDSQLVSYQLIHSISYTLQLLLVKLALISSSSIRFCNLYTYICE
jgi:hypothetical protein